MVQRERNNIVPSRTTTIVHLFKGPNQMEMKKPVEWWQAAILVIGFGLTVGGIVVNFSNKQTETDTRVKALETIYMDRLGKIEQKQDEQSRDTREILIILQNKADRK